MWAAAVWDSGLLCVLTGADLIATPFPSQHTASAGQLGPNYPQAVSHIHTHKHTNTFYVQCTLLLGDNIVFLTANSIVYA